MPTNEKRADAEQLFENAPPPRVAELAALCDRVIDAAAELKRQALAGTPDVTLLPADVADRLAGHLYDNPHTTAAAVVSRCVTFWFRCVANVEEVAPDLARLLLAGRPVEPVGSGKGAA